MELIFFKEKYNKILWKFKYLEWGFNRKKQRINSKNTHFLHHLVTTTRDFFATRCLVDTMWWIGKRKLFLKSVIMLLLSNEDAFCKGFQFASLALMLSWVLVLHSFFSNTEQFDLKFFFFFCTSFSYCKRR